MQILVLPFRKKSDEDFEYLLFKRSDIPYWQGIAGGAENDETPIEAAKREVLEETGIPSGSSYYKLQMEAHVPATEFKASKDWDKNIYVVPEYYFAVKPGNHTIKLSKEHTECRWASYEEEISLLKWDSNKTGLYELNTRLRNGDLIMIRSSK